MKTQNYKISQTVNGNFINYYVNFNDSTYAKVTLRSYQTRNGKMYNKVGTIEGNYNSDKYLISADEIFGTVEIIELSDKKAEVSKIVNHKYIGEVEILSSSNGKLRIKTKSGEEKMVLESLFMNNVI